MANIEIRALLPAEVGQLAGLVRELAAYHNEISEGFSGAYPVYSIETQLGEAAKMVADGEALVLGAFEDETLDGFGMASVSGKNGEIEFLFLRPHLREQGLGGELMRLLMEYLKNNGATFVDLRVVIGNPAREFYESFGFRTRSAVMSMKL